LEGSVVVSDIRKAKKGHGLNAGTNQIVDNMLVDTVSAASKSVAATASLVNRRRSAIDTKFDLR
jgi:chaperonin GroEL (HSP60 family)